MSVVQVFKTKKAALAAVWSLSDTSKMPGASWGINADACKTGAKMAKIPGTICADCYAQKGFYVMPTTKNAEDMRLERYNADPASWVSAMTKLVGSESWFRWFDAGDLQSVEMLADIVTVCEATPKTRHWLATREFAIVQAFLDAGGVFPSNLVVRLSAMKYDAPIKNRVTAWSSAVHRDQPAQGHECPASQQGGKCGDCRACWDRNVTLVSYKAH